MGHSVKNYILLTEKSWHDSLYENLVKSSSSNWIRIRSRQAFAADNLQDIKPEKIFIPHWSYIIPSSIYEPYECIVFHMTDLPFGRGGSPLQNLIVKGFETTMLTAIRVEKGIDTGPVYLKKGLSLKGTATEIFQRASTIIETMIFEIIDNDLKPVPQHGEVTSFARRKPEESDVANLQKTKEMYDYIRMLDCEGYPKAYLESECFKFELSQAALQADESITANVRIIKK